MLRLPRVIGLRRRLVLAFCGGALLVASLMAVAAYAASSRYLVGQRQDAAIRQTMQDAVQLQNRLSAGGASVDAILRTVDGPLASSSIARVGDQWYSSALVPGGDRPPEQLRARLGTGEAGQQRVILAGSPSLVVGVPLPVKGAEYYEVFSLSDLDTTLRTLSRALVATAALAVVGGALAGFLASRQLVKPLRAVSHASTQIAGGQLDTRLPLVDDPDVARLVRSYNDMADALQRRIVRDSRFAGDVSHELRSPLMTLEASVTVLESRRDELSDRSQRALGLLGAEIRRFSRMVEDLLEISRSESTEGEQRAELRLSDLLLHLDTSAVIDMSSDALGAYVRVDKRRLERVLRNLVENAEQYGGGVVGISVRRHGDCVRIGVDDDGPGVPEAERDRVFERFARGVNSSRRGDSGGTGLGLAIVAEHVSRSGGRVWVEDREPAGARFVVELPVQRWS